MTLIAVVRISQALSLRSKFLKDSHAREVLKSTRDEDKSVVEGHMEQVKIFCFNEKPKKVPLPHLRMLR